MSDRLAAHTRMALTAGMVWQAPLEARFPFRPAAAIRRAQERRVRATVGHAYRHVPYYRETMRRLGLSPADLRGATDLARLPLIERLDLQRDPEYFASEAWPPTKCMPVRSDGSTGAPLTLFRDPPALFADAVQRERQRSIVARLAGHRLRYREAFISPPGSTLKAIEAFRRSSLLPPSVRVQRRVFSTDRSPTELIPELERYRADVIAGHGSHLEALFLHIRRSGIRLRLPRVVRYGADGMSDAARRFVLKDLGVEVLGTYGAIEAPMIGFECEMHRGYHLNIDLYPIRLIGPDGRETSAGEEGEVVVSNLVNRGTILLNYRLGDLAAWSTEPCPCGRNLPVLSHLPGKLSPWIDLGEGRVLHPHAVRLLMRTEPSIWRYQLVQEDRRRFLLRLVVSGECEREETAERVRTGLGEALGRDVAIRIEYVVDLPRGQGKPQPIVALPPNGSG